MIFASFCSSFILQTKNKLLTLEPDFSLLLDELVKLKQQTYVSAFCSYGFISFVCPLKVMFFCLLFLSVAQFAFSLTVFRIHRHIDESDLVAVLFKVN